MIKTKTGQVFNGVILSEGETTVLSDALGNKVVIAPENIAHQEELPVGLMPDAASMGLSETDLNDLTSYLLTLK